ncbi:MAG: class I SAM-dependent methyltransferase [Bdellovibrionales bacterium]|nr:class I SAM-dependent methyltransferase [Bdellovibrionales bacterium]
MNLSLCPVCGAKEIKMVYKDLYDDRYGYPDLFDLRECAQCGHKFVQNHFKNEDLELLYTKYYPRSKYDISDYRPFEEIKGFRGWFNGEKRAFAFVPRNCKVLDIGCGYGESVGYHKLRGCDSYGIEADSNVKSIADRYQLNIKIGSFTGYEFESNYFDYITMDQVLEHSIDPIKTFIQVNRVLKLGGQFIITIPNGKGWGAREFGRKWIHWHVPYHLQFFSKRSLKIAAKRCGFKIKLIKSHTSSEWLYYQKIQNLVFPNRGQESYFFSPNVNFESASGEVLAQRDVLLHRHLSKKVNHIKTRWKDMIGVGDNLIVIFKKISDQKELK